MTMGELAIWLELTVYGGALLFVAADLVKSLRRKKA